MRHWKLCEPRTVFPISRLPLTNVLGSHLLSCWSTGPSFSLLYLKKWITRSFECFEHRFIYFCGWMRGRPLHVERLEDNLWSCFSLSTVWALGNRLRPLGSGVSTSTCWTISLIHPAALKMKSISMVRSESHSCGYGLGSLLQGQD